MSSLSKTQLEGIVKIANPTALSEYIKRKNRANLCPSGYTPVIKNGIGMCKKSPRRK